MTHYYYYLHSRSNNGILDYGLGDWEQITSSSTTSGTTAPPLPVTAADSGTTTTTSRQSRTSTSSDINTGSGTSSTSSDDDHTTTATSTTTASTLSTPMGVTATAMLYMDAMALVSAAGVVGRQEEGDKYDAIANEVKEGYRSAFFHPGNSSQVGGGGRGEGRSSRRAWGGIVVVELEQDMGL